MATEQKSEETKALTPSGSRAIAVHDYTGFENQGFEHVGAADVTVPLISLQTFMSPKVKAGEAKPGDYLNSVTGEIYDGKKGFQFVAATTRHMVARWAVPRGTGFRGHLMPEDKLVMEAKKRHEKYRATHDAKIDKKARFGKMWSADETEDWVETFYIYGVPCSEDGEPLGFALLPHSSTKIEFYKKLQTQLSWIRLVGGKGRPPLFSYLMRIGSKLDSNTRNEEYHVPVYSPADARGWVDSMLPTDDPRFQAALALKKLVDSGEAKEDFAAQQDTDAEEEAGEGTGSGSGPY